MRRLAPLLAVVAAVLILAPPVVLASPHRASYPRAAVMCPPTGGPDFNGDGLTDIAGIDPNNDMRLYTGDGAGHVIGGALMWPGGGLWWNYHLIAAADFTGDGHADLAGVDPYGNLLLFTGDGAGHLTGGTMMWPTSGAFTGYRFLVAGDFTNDGRSDLAGVDGSGNLHLYVGDGAGHVTGGGLMWPANGGWSGFTDITAGDFTGDGNVDIAGLNAYHDMGLYLGDGAGHLVVAGAGTPMWPTGGLWAGFTHIVAGDFDSDGFADIPGINAYHDLGLYRGDGTGHLNTGSGDLMWPGGGQWSGFHALTATSGAACWRNRTVVMPLGDSITYGTASTSGDGYRAPLAGLLNTAAPMGRSWLYEGSINSGDSWWSNEGHGGATIDYLNSHLGGWLPVAGNAGLPVTLVLLDAGTNDAAANRTSAQMLASMSTLLNNLLATDPGVRVMVAQVTITTSDTAAQRQAEAGFDTGLPALAASKGPQVAVVDMRGVALSGDGLHPGDAGYQDMANRWYAALTTTGWLP